MSNKKLIGVSGGIGIMLLDGQIHFMMQQSINDMYGIPNVRMGNWIRKQLLTSSIYDQAFGKKIAYLGGDRSAGTRPKPLGEDAKCEFG